MRAVLFALFLGLAMETHAQTENFDKAGVGALPQGWKTGVTGKGTGYWAVNPDPSAPSAPNVLTQLGQGTFPWAVREGTNLTDGFVEVKFPTKEVRDVAKARDAIPYDIADVHFSHDGELCSFDAFLKHYRLNNPALQQLAVIVRGADTARLELAPQAPGLAAMSLGLSRNFADDHEMLKHGMVMYDALYTWCKEGQDELHTWNPTAYA